MASAPTKPARMLLGHIGAAHGIRGEVMIRTYTADPADIAAYGPLSDEAGVLTFRISVVRVTDKGVVARITGVQDRTAAEALRGTALYIERHMLPAAAEREYYHADLVGLAVLGPDGARIGEVVAVQNFGAGDLLEIRLTGTSRTELIAFTDDFVPTVDLAARTATVILPVDAPDDDTPR